MSAETLPFFDQPGREAACREVARTAEPPGLAPAGTPSAPTTVTALIARVKGALADALPPRVYVLGEVSNLKLHESGHVYFRLKDADCAIDCAMFRQHARRCRFDLSDGLEVVAEGRVDVYDVRGQLQLYVEHITPRGAGALELAFRQLCEKLRKEGLFDPSRKKLIPRFPRAVGVVTSATGAAVRDIRRTLLRRWPAARVFLLPSNVQGEGAAGQIAECVRLLDDSAGRFDIDTIIVARGGGSLEDLWAFNEEIVARAIFAAGTPIISGVGHEVDVTVADMVADARAATPTAAAELAVPDASEVSRHVRQLSSRLGRIVAEAARNAGAQLEAVLRSVVFRDPAQRVRTQVQRLDELSHRLRAAMGERLRGARSQLEPAAGRLAVHPPSWLLQQKRAQLSEATHNLSWMLGRRSKQAGDALAGVAERLSAVRPAHRLALARQRITALARQLEAMSYRNVLKRGYSVTRNRAREVIRSPGQVAAGERIETELAEGKLASRVEPTESKAHATRRTGRNEKTLFD